MQTSHKLRINANTLEDIEFQERTGEISSEQAKRLREQTLQSVIDLLQEELRDKTGIPTFLKDQV